MARFAKTKHFSLFFFLFVTVNLWKLKLLTTRLIKGSKILFELAQGSNYWCLIEKHKARECLTTYSKDLIMCS